MEVKILKMDHQGKGIGKLNSKIVFVSNALIDEIVKIKIIKDSKKYMVAENIGIINKNPKRIEPACPYHNDCGGCDLMHVDYTEQLKIKQNMIENICNRYLDKKIVINDIIYDEQFYYRNKITLQVNDKLGYFKKNSHQIIEIDKCLIANKQINKLITKVKDTIKSGKIMIRCSENTNDKMIIFTTKEKVMIDQLKNDVTSIVVNNKTVYGKDKMFENLNNYRFIISPMAFFQTNPKMTIKLYDLIVSLTKFNQTDNVLDLYCGTGTIGIYISKYVNKVLGIEINESAINDANENKKINNISNVSFICGDVSSILARNEYNPDIVIVDPPRKGLDKKTINELLKIESRKIIYVSCNPITLVRDLQLLADKYDIMSITPVDMFPNTYHCESVCILRIRLSKCIIC